MSTPLRILLLEDNPSDAELNQHALRKAGIGFQALRVERAEAYLEALVDFQPDLILADYNLPNFDGLKALRLLRARNADLPFIFVTGAMGRKTPCKLCARAPTTTFSRIACTACPRP
ncbi:MAG: response regulator [Candidatus Competibacteraceae bacterium]